MLLHEALGMVRESRLGGHMLADCLDWLAAVDGSQGQARRAARLFGAAEAQWRASGAVRYAPEKLAYERDVAAVLAKLDQHSLTAAWATGRAMSAEEAVDYALNETGHAKVPRVRSLHANSK
jgi:hypothetical protein